MISCHIYFQNNHNRINMLLKSNANISMHAYLLSFNASLLLSMATKLYVWF